MKPKVPPDANDLLGLNTRANKVLAPVTKYVLTTFLVGTLLVAGVYVTMIFLTINVTEWVGTCEVSSIYRVNCSPGRMTTYEECTEIRCCFDETSKTCYHTVPSRYGYAEDTSNSTVLRPKEPKSPFGSENKPVNVLINCIDPEHVRIDLTLLADQRNLHYVETERAKRSENSPDYMCNNSLNSIQVDHGSNSKSQFAVTLTRNNKSIMTTSKGPFIITETYWEWSLFLGNSSVYGLNSEKLNGTFNWIYNNRNDTIIPGFLRITNDMSIGCYIGYNGPMEIEVLPSNLIILRGISMPNTLSIHVFSGETPQDVTKQFAALLRTEQVTEVALSNLGLHICPENNQDIIDKDLTWIIEHMKSQGAPWDSYCIHKKFYPTLDKVLSQTEHEFLKATEKLLNETGRSVLHHVSNLCSYGKNNFSFELEGQSLLLKNSSGPYVGVSDSESVCYPDWLDERTLKIYDSKINELLQVSPTSKFLYLRDLWPRDDSNITMDFSKFDYVPKELRTLMSKGSVPIDLSSSTEDSHYKIHNAYAREFQAFAGKYANSIRVELLNEDTFGGWSALRKILSRTIASGLLGQPPPAIYMCSIKSPSNDDLCQRWYGIGVVFPHVLAVPQNMPGGDWLSDGASKYVIKLLKLRASLVSYQYSTIAEYYNSGAPILAPTHFHYPDNVYVKYMENQFMWGESILVGAVTLPSTFQVQMRIPGLKSWRHLQGGQEVNPTGSRSVSVSILEGEIVTLLRPGHIIPFHENPALTTWETRRGPLKLVGNLADIEGNYQASGKIFYDRGAFLNITFNNTSLKLERVIIGGDGVCPNQTTILISSLEILGRQTVYTIGLNVSFCDFYETIYSFTI